MTTEPNDTDAGRGGLRAHVSSAEPPRELASRVLGTLESRGLVSPAKRRGSPWISRIAVLAAGLVLGILARSAFQEQRESRGTIAVQSPIDQYVLLLYGDTPGDTGAVHVAREAEYGRWASALGAGVRWVGGHELHDVVAQFGDSTSPVGSDAPPERLAGFFVIEAQSREQAAHVARTCPHLKYGGRVIVMTVAS